jgi:RNA polymerase sigma-70 factor (ECF subfamily)
VFGWNPASARGRDRESRFDALYIAHRQTLHAYFLGKTGDGELALDLLQDTFVRVWRSLDIVDGASEERQRAWLYSIARNLVVDQYRRQATRRAVAVDLIQEAAVKNVSAAPPDVELSERERRQAVDRAIQRLPEDLRTVLVLQLVGERTSGEIGELLGKPAGTVRYQLAEARRRLAADLQLVEAVTE